MSEDFLHTMAQASRERVARALAICGLRELQARALALPAAPKLKLSGGFDLIAEVKLRSPAAGLLQQEGEDIGARVAAYADAGAAAISVLTEPSRFDGALSHLTRAVQGLAGRIPVMRKDFLVDRLPGVRGARGGSGRGADHSADAEASRARGADRGGGAARLFALLEAFDQADLATGRRAGARVMVRAPRCWSA